MLNGLKSGQRLLRREVHERYGGRRQGGIGPSREAPVVLFFTDPATGHQHGYYDGWDDDKLFNYVGEGQTGDQRMVQGNKAILNHVRKGGAWRDSWRRGRPSPTSASSSSLSTTAQTLTRAAQMS